LDLYAVVLAVGFFAGCVGGVVGTGASAILLPVLAWAFGPMQAVPLMVIAAVMANLARVGLWWRDVSWRAVVLYSLPGVPAAMLGARTLLRLPARHLDLSLGIFFLLLVPLRRRLPAACARLNDWQLALAGGGIGYLTGLLFATGPLSVTAFAAYGLVNGAFLATESASALAFYLAKAGVFGGSGVLPVAVLLKGCLVGSSLMAGTALGKRIVLGMSPARFRYAMDVVLLWGGVSFMIGAFRA